MNYFCMPTFCINLNKYRILYTDFNCNYLKIQLYD